MLNYNEIERALTNGATESKVITKLSKIRQHTTR